jgi:hypothetical protein
MTIARNVARGDARDEGQHRRELPQRRRPLAGGASTPMRTMFPVWAVAKTLRAGRR